MICEQQIGKYLEGRSLRLIWTMHRHLPNKNENK